MRRKQRRTLQNRNPVDLGQKVICFLSIFGSVKSGNVMQRRNTVAVSKLVQERRRKSRGQLTGYHRWVFADLAAVACWPRRHERHVIAVTPFLGQASRQPVSRSELMIDLRAVQLALEGIGILSREASGARDRASDPPMNGRVQAIHRLAAYSRRAIERVRPRHQPDQSGHVTGAVHLLAVW